MIAMAVAKERASGMFAEEITQDMLLESLGLVSSDTAVISKFVLQVEDMMLSEETIEALERGTLPTWTVRVIAESLWAVLNSKVGLVQYGAKSWPLEPLQRKCNAMEHLHQVLLDWEAMEECQWKDIEPQVVKKLEVLEQACIDSGIHPAIFEDRRANYHFQADLQADSDKEAVQRLKEKGRT